jgi:Zn finger protein HypA/HybF involved in hydrogenase expression
MTKNSYDMNLEDFKKYCEEHDDNLMSEWNYNKFKIQCQKCNSFNVKIVDDLEHHEGHGCPTCGYESYNSGRLIVKCISCGSAIQILSTEDLS